jgi:hypothetical protein
MLEDAVSVLDAGEQIAVRDVAELLALSVGVAGEEVQPVELASAERIGNG